MTAEPRTVKLCSGCAISLDTKAPTNPDWQTHRFYLDRYQMDHRLVLRSPHGSRHGIDRQPGDSCDVCGAANYSLLWTVTAHDVSDKLPTTYELVTCSTCLYLLTAERQPWANSHIDNWKANHPTATVEHHCSPCNWWSMRRCDICLDNTTGNRHHALVQEHI